MRQSTIQRVARCVAIVFLTTVAFVWPTPTFGQGGLPNSIPAPPDSFDFGSSLASGGDANNDGCDDIFIMDALYRNAEDVPVGKWYLYSGCTGRLLWSQQGILPNNGERARGANAEFIGDVDNDECDDLILGLPGLLDGHGGVAVLSGRSGALLFYEIGEFEYAELGRDVSPAGDYNNDDIPDIAFITNREGLDGGVTFVRSGADFSEGLGAGATQTSLIRRVAMIGDTGGRGYSSVVYSQWAEWHNSGWPMEIIRNRDEIEIPPPDFTKENGYQVAGGLDVTGDDVPDFVASFGSSGGLGELAVYSGQTLGLVRTISASTYRLDGLLGFNIDLADPNGDGQGEVIAGDEWSMNVFDAVSGEMMHRVPANPHGGSGGFVYGEEYAMGDVNGDGFDDYIAGAFEDDVTEEVEVRVYGGSGVFLHLLNDLGEMSVDESIEPGSMVRFEITGALPYRNMHLLASRTGNGCTYIPPLETCIDLDRPIRQVGVAMTDENGVARFELEVSADAEPGTVWLQAGDPAHYWLGPVKSNVLRLEIVE